MVAAPETAAREAAGVPSDAFLIGACLARHPDIEALVLDIARAEYLALSGRIDAARMEAAVPPVARMTATPAQERARECWAHAELAQCSGCGSGLVRLPGGLELSWPFPVEAMHQCGAGRSREGAVAARDLPAAAPARRPARPARPAPPAWMGAR